MKTLKIKLTYPDANGIDIVEESTIEYDPATSGVVAEIDYTAPSGGTGPVMRPRKPRL